MKYDEWWDTYKPLKNHITEDAAYQDCMFETYGKDITYICDQINNHEKGKYVWTIVQGEPSEEITSWHIDETKTLHAFVRDRKHITISDVNSEEEALELIEEENYHFPDTYVIPGYHLVNRIGYFITEVPWKEEGLSTLEILID